MGGLIYGHKYQAGVFVIVLQSLTVLGGMTGSVLVPSTMLRAIRNKNSALVEKHQLSQLVPLSLGFC